MSQPSVHFNSNSNPSQGTKDSNKGDSKAQKSILSQKAGSNDPLKKAGLNTIQPANTQTKQQGALSGGTDKGSITFDNLPVKKSIDGSKGENKADTVSIGDKYQVSMTETGMRNDDDDDRYVQEMQSLVSKIKHKPPVGSVYQKDFMKYSLDPKPPKVNNNPWETFRIEQPIDFNTTSRNDYKNWNQGPPHRHSIDLWKAQDRNVPFGGRSSYKAEYLNWGLNPSAMEKPVAPKTVVSDLPFMGKSMYRENFKEPAYVTQLHKIDHNLFGKKSPLSPNIPFLGETTTGKTYQPYKVVVNPHANEKPGYEKVEAYPNQFTTTYGADFNNQTGPKFKTKSFKPKFSFV